MDKFHEQLIKTKKGGKYKLLSFGVYLCMALVALSVVDALMVLNLTMTIIAVIFLAWFFLLRYFRDRQYKEFEYIFTNGNLQIDVIYKMKKRKTLYDMDVKNFEDFGKYSEIKFGKEYKRISCAPWDDKNEKYVILLNDKERQAILIAPNEEMLRLINLYKVRRSRI